MGVFQNILPKHALRPYVRIKYQPSKDDEVSIGNSKLGGFPDLPQKTDWATFDKVPLSFLAQINLAELPDFEFRNSLPKNGLLSFFFSLETDAYELSPHKVLFSEASAALERKRQSPGARLPSCDQQ